MRHKAWLYGGNGVRVEGGKRRPGFYVCFNEYTQGRKIQRRASFPTIAKARRFMREHNERQAELALKRLPGMKPTTFGDALDEFFGGLAALARVTREHYARTIGFFTALCGEKALTAYGAGDVEQFCRTRLLEGASKATVAKDIRALSRFFRWARKRRYIDANPVEDATAVPKGRFARVRPVIGESDLARLVGKLKTEDQRLAVWIAATTGLDRGVIAELTAGNVDIEGMVLRAIRKKRHATGQVLALPLHPDIAALLRPRLDAAPAGERLVKGVWKQTFQTDWFKIAAEAAGLRGVTFRDLRAYAVQRGLKAGIPLTTMSRMLGHSSVTVTAAHYTLPDPQAALRLGELTVPGIT